MTNPEEKFLKVYGITNPSYLRIKEVRNSNVWKISSSKGQWILKKYHASNEDLRDRLGTEFRFLKFLFANGIRNIPEPLFYNQELKLGLYRFLPGESIHVISEWHIQQSADFICTINRLKTEFSAKNINFASESCLSLKEHLKLIFGRLESLKIFEVKTSEDEKVKNLVNEKLIPAFLNLEKNLLKTFSSEIFEYQLNSSEQILSPSDFGFHNVLVNKKTLYFVDFEYAGWDDPAKLFCDFSCQPELPVTPEQAETFRMLVSQELKLQDTGFKVEVLLPFYRLKWCCILLNEFRAHDRERRKHSTGEKDDSLHLQLSKARFYFNKYLGDI